MGLYSFLEYDIMEYIIYKGDCLIMGKSIYSDAQKFLINQLKKARADAGFDQKKVAKLLGKTQSHISKIESGQRRIDVIQLKEFAEIYNKPVNFFFE